jgi:hypothetical protein
MTKSLLTGMAVFAAVAVFAGNGDAYAHRKPVYAKVYAKKLGPVSNMSLLRAKGGPLHDCVHVLFPQCSRGYGEPND